MLYELTIITPATITERGIDELIEVVHDHSTKIIRVENEGVKRLPYPIHEHDRGRYLFFYLEMDGDGPSNLNKALGINDNALRYLLIRTRIQGK